MNNIIKPKSINMDLVNNYVSVIGLSPCMLYQIIYFETLDLDKIQVKYNINNLDFKTYLEQLNAAKLVQTFLVGESIQYQLFKPILTNDVLNEQKWNIISNHKILVEDNKTNISPTYMDVYGKNYAKTIEIDYNLPWLEFYEKLFDKNVDVETILDINKLQVQQKLKDPLINIAMEQTLKKCNIFNIKYLSKVCNTFNNLEINTVDKAKLFFEGKLFEDQVFDDKNLQELDEFITTMD